MRGVVDVCHSETAGGIEWLDRLAFWDQTEEQEGAARLEARRAWHGDLIRRRALAALQLVHHAASKHPLLNLGQHVATAHRATAAIATAGGSSSSPGFCPVVGDLAAVNAVQATLDRLAERFGSVSDRRTLIDAIGRTIIEAGPRRIPLADAPPATPREVITFLAHHLQSTEFVTLVDQVAQAVPAAHHANVAAKATAASVPLWDKLNVFTDSDAEQARDKAACDASSWELRARQKREQLEACYRRALALHPPSLLLDDGTRVIAAIRAIWTESVRRTRTHRVGKSTRTEVYYVCKIHGVARASGELARWARQLVGLVGHIPSAGDLLETWVASELR